MEFVVNLWLCRYLVGHAHYDLNPCLCKCVGGYPASYGGPVESFVDMALYEMVRAHNKFIHKQIVNIV